MTGKPASWFPTHRDMKRLLTSIASFVSWHRRAFGALFAAAAVLLFAQAVIDPPRDTVEVLVVAREVPAGHTLTASDVRTTAVPRALVPEAVLRSARKAVGQVSAVALTPGTALQPGLLTSRRTAARGRAVVPVRIGDEQLRQFLRPGERVSLVTLSGETNGVVARDARITAAPTSTSGPALAGAGGPRGALIMVEVAARDAPAVASLGQNSQLSVVLGTL